MEYRYLALTGGGAKGYAYIGAFEELNKLGIFKDLDMLAGSSVGAIFSLLFATNWPTSKVLKKLDELDFNKFVLKDSPLTPLPIIGPPIEAISKVKNIFTHYGLHEAQELYDWFKNIIKEVTGNENATFNDWHQYKVENPTIGLKDICVEACNLNISFNEVFSFQTDYKDVLIADAIRASMAFPFIFTPWIIKNNMFADGGMQRNCPINVFESTPGVPNPLALSLWLDDADNIRYFEDKMKPKSEPIHSFISFIDEIMESITNAQSYDLLTGPYKNMMIYCDTLGVSTLQFNLDINKKQALIESGKYGVIRYFHQQHPELTQKVYDSHTLSLIEKFNFPKSLAYFLNKLSKEDIEQFKGTNEDNELPLFIKWHRVLSTYTIV